MTDEAFFDKVYFVTKQIPPGRVTSYGAIAKFIGAPGAARMVGWALNNSKNNETHIPAHRVVNRNGMLTGKSHFPGADVMKQLLENEGVIVKNDKVVDFERIFWDPYKKLGR
ncbi:MAG: MGMT family protein [Bacteroidales bacterium]